MKSIFTHNYELHPVYTSQNVNIMSVHMHIHSGQVLGPGWYVYLTEPSGMYTNQKDVHKHIHRVLLTHSATNQHFYL